jgi:hypothetical protein
MILKIVAKTKKRAWLHSVCCAARRSSYVVLFRQCRSATRHLSRTFSLRKKKGERFLPLRPSGRASQHELGLHSGSLPGRSRKRAKFYQHFHKIFRTSEGSLSAVSKPIFATKYSFRRIFNISRSKIFTRAYTYASFTLLHRWVVFPGFFHLGFQLMHRSTVNMLQRNTSEQLAMLVNFQRNVPKQSGRFTQSMQKMINFRKFSYYSTSR